MGIFGKMEESGKQRQTNPRIVRGNPIWVVFVCGHDELRNDASFSLKKESTENKKNPLGTSIGLFLLPFVLGGTGFR